MARPKRIDLPFSVYHVFSRTVSREKAFIDLWDQKKFLGYLARFVDIYSFHVHCWCFMPNHFHLLLESGNRDGLSDLMHRLLTAYTVYFNRRHSRHGHLFQGRFRSLIVDKSSYLLSVSRYIHLNPLEAKITKKPEKYKGSSLKFFINGGEPEYLCSAEILNWFEGNREKYAEFIREGLEEDIKPDILRQRYIGGEAFARRTKQRFLTIEKRKKRIEKREPNTITKNEEETKRKAEEILKIVSDYFGMSGIKIIGSRHARDETRLSRKVLITLLRENLPWTINQIGSFVGINDRGSIHKHLKEVREQKEIRKMCEKIGNEVGINLHKPRG